MGAPHACPPVQLWSRLLGESLAALTGHQLVAGLAPQDPGYARALFDSALPLVSHGTEPDPLFNYANRAALDLWGMGWEDFTGMPSRLSAADDPAIQGDRSRFLREAAEKGWVADYSGQRIAANGRRFRIAETLLWTIRDASGQIRGQAALIGKVTVA